MKKRFYLLLTCIISLLLTGCFTKKPITTEDFVKEANNKNYRVVNAIEQYGRYEEIEEATIARSKDNNYQIEFYVLNSSKSAAAMFDSNKELFEQDSSIIKSRFTSNINNYSVYKLLSNNKFRYLCRVDSTLLYINADDKYKKELEEFIKNIGY